MTKSHCDVCDSTESATSRVAEFVRIDGPHNMRHELNSVTMFRTRYEDAEQDLCNSCKRKVFAALFVKYGGKLGPQEVV